MTNSLYIAADHAGFELKEHLKKKFAQITWKDLGTNSLDSVDYPDFADRLSVEISSHSDAMGVLICGSGQGMAMRANRYSKIRAALCWSEETARLAREHNNANVLCLGSRVTSQTECEQILEMFLQTQFAGGRHQRRLDKMGLKPTPC